MITKERKNKDAGLTVLEQVARIFFSIDEKIIDLHKCSTDDFLSLNKTLKSNHQKASFITDNLSSAIEKIGPKGNLQSISELKIGFGELQEEIQIFEKEINGNLIILERIQTNLSLMFLPFNNLRQNLGSLKLLLSNIKLTNNLCNRSLKNFSEAESIRIEGVINKVRESCPVFEENIYVIQKHVKLLHQDLSKLKELIFSELLRKLEMLQNDFDTIEKHHKEWYTQKESIETITQKLKTDVGGIITNLQYHDVIRRKMDNIQQTHKLIINELNQKNIFSVNPDEPDPANLFLFQIPQFLEIQTSQLLHTNKDYQKAVDRISKKMIDLGQDMSAIANIYKTLNKIEYQDRSVSKEKIVKLFNEMLGEKSDSIAKYMELSKDITIIQKIINDLFDKFRDLEMIENSIEQTIIDKISFENLLISEEKETATQAQQILKLYADNHFEKNKIRTLFENTNCQLIEFIKLNVDFLKNKKGIFKLNTNFDAAEANFSKVTENIDFLENIMDDIIAHSHEINEASKEVVANVKYYNFFERTTEELLAHFKFINTLLFKHGSIDKLNHKNEFVPAEKYYTVK